MEKIDGKAAHKLPVGTHLHIHSRDKYGVPQYLDCYIVLDKNKKKQLQYSNGYLVGVCPFQYFKVDDDHYYEVVKEV